MVEQCPQALFCCASVLCRQEFLTLVGALEGRHFSASGSGLRELHGVFSELADARRVPRHALASRILFRSGCSTITSLSPTDDVFQRFLAFIGQQLPSVGTSKTRIQSLSPNDVAVALWVDVQYFSLLLGADLEKRGWVSVLSDQLPNGRASAFKIPHHGSRNAHEPEVWQRMVTSDPIAVVTPWRRGGKALPTRQDVERILALAPSAFCSSGSVGMPRSRSIHANRAVSRTLRESGVRLRSLTGSTSAVRLRRPIGSETHWSVTLLGNACRLNDFAA